MQDNNQRKRRGGDNGGDEFQEQQQHEQRHKGENGQYTSNQNQMRDSFEEIQQKLYLQQKQITPEIVIIESGGQDDNVDDDIDIDIDQSDNSIVNNYININYTSDIQMTDMLYSLNETEQDSNQGGFERVGRTVVLDWIRQQYESEGFKRCLTAQDEMGLLKQAGFSSRQMDKSIPSTNFQLFRGKFKEALNMLRLVAFYWNVEDPYVIAGFDCDKARAEGALKNLPPKTFLIRMSFGEFGKLVISVVNNINNNNINIDINNNDNNMEDINNVVHYSIQVKDLGNKNLGQMVMGLKSAEMLLDVFSLRLIEKSKVFVEGGARGV